jgi:hypothetical protein
MKRKISLSAMLVACLILGRADSPPFGDYAQRQAQRPNIIIIMSDDAWNKSERWPYR